MKTRNLLLVAAFGLAWLLQSCSIATTVHFNKNYSGSYMTVMDMSELISMSSMFDSTGTNDQETVIAQMRHSMDSLGIASMYNAMSGIRNARLDVSDEGVITLAFDFDNLTALNASFVRMAEHAELNPGSGNEMLPTDLFSGSRHVFKNEGKALLYTMENTGEGGGLFGAGGDDMEGMDFMANMMDYTIDLSFDRKVKSADVKGLTLLETGSNKVKTRVDIMKLMSDGGYSIKVNTK